MGTTRRLILKHKELTKKVNNKTKHKRQCQELTLRLYWRPDAISVTSRESGTPLWLLTSSWSATAFISSTCTRLLLRLTKLLKL